MPQRKRHESLVHKFVVSFVDLPCPSNISYSWSYGSLLGVFYVVQTSSGLALSVFYSAGHAFSSVNYIHRDIENGWALRLMHANGASFFLGLMYMHMLRGLYFCSFTRVPSVWYSGLGLLLMSMAAAFFGYVLPWGQMSYWGATVITNLFTVVPVIGGTLVEMLWGGYTVGENTLTRFYTFHFLSTLSVGLLAMAHILLLHGSGSSNPLGSLSRDWATPFHPYCTVMDMGAWWGVLMFFGVVVLSAPHLLGSPDNFEMANSLKTPPHIMPEWYFLPFYAILRSIPHKASGVLLMGGSLGVFFFLPLGRAPLSSVGYYRREVLFWVFIFNCFALGWLGACPLESPFLVLGLIHSGVYFGYFLLDYIMCVD